MSTDPELMKILERIAVALETQSITQLASHEKLAEGMEMARETERRQLELAEQQLQVGQGFSSAMGVASARPAPVLSLVDRSAYPGTSCDDSSHSVLRRTLRCEGSHQCIQVASKSVSWGLGKCAVYCSACFEARTPIEGEIVEDLLFASTGQ